MNVLCCLFSFAHPRAPLPDGFSEKHQTSWAKRSVCCVGSRESRHAVQVWWKVDKGIQQPLEISCLYLWTISLVNTMPRVLGAKGPFVPAASTNPHPNPLCFRLTSWQMVLRWLPAVIRPNWPLERRLSPPAHPPLSRQWPPDGRQILTGEFFFIPSPPFLHSWQVQLDQVKAFW